MLRSLAMRYKTAIVSGRARLTAHGLVQLDELYYAGSHGFDIAGPRKPHDSDDGIHIHMHIIYARRARSGPHARAHAGLRPRACMHPGCNPLPRLQPSVFPGCNPLPRLQPSAQAATLCVPRPAARAHLVLGR